jgi:glycosyltransferase involved in cell wall biosynthesis
MFNAQEFLGLAVNSVRAQTFVNWELVLFDDGSSDRTLEIAHEFAGRDHRIRVVAGANGGTARARNRGLDETTPGSEFVIFLDNDDTWELTALEVLTRTLDEHPSAPAAHGLARAIDPQGQQFPGDDLAQSMAQRREMRYGRVSDLPADAPTTFEALLIQNYPVTPGTILVRRRVWEKTGGYVPETVPCDDWDMHLRIARCGGIVLVNQIILNWRRHPGAASHNTRRWRNAYLLVRKRTILSEENTEQQRQAAVSAFQLTCRTAWADVRHHLLSGRLAASSRALARWILYQTAYWRVIRAAAT